MGTFNIVCCVYCYMECEDKFALQATDIKVMVPYKIRREKEKGKWVDKKVKLVPGYAFIFADDIPQVLQTIRNFKVRLLYYSNGSPELIGQDLKFAKWIFNNGGIVGVSSAIHEKDHIKIISGPLKESEGIIVQLNRRHQLAKVELQIGFSVWLSYDWLEN